MQVKKCKCTHTRNTKNCNRINFLHRLTCSHVRFIQCVCHRSAFRRISSWTVEWLSLLLLSATIWPALERILSHDTDVATMCNLDFIIVSNFLYTGARYRGARDQLFSQEALYLQPSLSNRILGPWS